MSDVPPEAPEHCPGTASEQAGKSAACAGCPNQAVCATAPKGEDPDLALIAERMKDVKHKILVLSGKGGVGKSTFSAQLSFALAAQGKEVGLLDIDICGPSIPKMLGLQGEEIHQSSSGWSPVYVEDNLAVMSIGFMLPNPDEAVIWRGPRKNGLIKQFLRDVHWGALDYLVIDAPPGTSDEHITITQCLRAGSADGAVVVTTPQDVSIIDVRKEISFCKKVGLRVLGVVENMAGLVQPLEQVTFFSVAQPDAGTCTGNGTAATVAAASGTTEVNSCREEVCDKPNLGGEVDMTADVARVLAAAFPGLQLYTHSEVFAATKGGAASMCRDMNVPLLGRVPLDPNLGRAAEQGRSIFDAESGSKAVCIPALQFIVQQVIRTVEAGAGVQV